MEGPHLQDWGSCSSQGLRRSPEENTAGSPPGYLTSASDQMQPPPPGPEHPRPAAPSHPPHLRNRQLFSRSLGVTLHLSSSNTPHPPASHGSSPPLPWPSHLDRRTASWRDPHSHFCPSDPAVSPATRKLGKCRWAHCRGRRPLWLLLCGKAGSGGLWSGPDSQDCRTLGDWAGCLHHSASVSSTALIGWPKIVPPSQGWGRG